jgi:hypothetical protein
MPKMAVGSDHTPFLTDAGRVGHLCRELRDSGIEPLLPFTREADPAAGVALSVDAALALASDNAASQLKQQAFDILAAGLPLSVTVFHLGSGNEAGETLAGLCELLRAAADSAGVMPGSIEIVIEATSLSPQGAWLCRSNHLGDGPLYLLPESSMLRPDQSPSQRNRHERFWLQLWHLRMTRTLRVAYASVVVSPCPLLSAEAAYGVLPSVCLQVPLGSAWLPLRIDVARFADDRGVIQDGELENALCQGVELGDELHRLVAWPTAQARHDAWLNRRLAIIATGFGDLVQRRGLDPGCFKALQGLCDEMHTVKSILHRQSRQIALRDGHVPALSQNDPSRAMPRGVVRESWHKRWSKAAELAATGHRNLLVLPLWSVFPQYGPADYRYSDLLPVLANADACAFPTPPDLSHWNVSQFKSFHQRAWAVIQQRDAAHQIAERI